MKNTNILLPFIITTLSLFMIFSCSKDNDLHQAQPDKKITPRTDFEPSVTYDFDDGYLQFESFDDLDAFLAEVNLADPGAVNDWEDNLGLISQRKIFSKAMISEDSLESYLTSLSPSQQTTVLGSGEYHSTRLNSAITNGKLKNYTGNDASVFWDYTLVEPSVAAAVNSDGLVKVDSLLIKYSNGSFIYIAKDGDPGTIATAEAYTDDFEDDDMKVIKLAPYNPDGPNHPTENDPGLQPRGSCSSYATQTINFSLTHAWVNPTSKKRVRAWIDGSATSNWGSPCRYGTTCTFFLRTQAQKKNFWGKWVYSSEWSPSCQVDDGDWDYTFELIDPAGACESENTTTYTNAISGGSGFKPVWDIFIPHTNNGFIPMHPNTSGWWLFYEGENEHGGKQQKNICRTIDITYDIPVTYYTYGTTTWNLHN